MNKNSFAIAFALVGFGVGTWLSVDLDWNLWTSGIIGACLGAFVGYFVAGLRSAKGTILQENFQKLGTLSGKTLQEIEAACGPHTSFTTCTITDRDNAPGFFYNWTESNYSITLLFDASNICIGVSDETKIEK